MKKYIITLPENIDCVQWVLWDKDGHKYSDIQDVGELEPYVLPHIDKARKDAYQSGYNSRAAHVKENDYEQGLSDIWEATKIITKMTQEEKEEIFGTHHEREILELYTAAEAMDRLKKHEMKLGVVKAGDEVEDGDGDRAVVLDADDDNGTYYVFTENGLTDKWDRTKDGVSCTGYHYPEIAAILKKLRRE